MAKREAKPAMPPSTRFFAKSPDGLREIVRAVMQEMLEAEISEALVGEKDERTVARLGYRSGHCSHTLERPSRTARGRDREAIRRRPWSRSTSLVRIFTQSQDPVQQRG
jgi:hypothetical protein